MATPIGTVVRAAQAGELEAWATLVKRFEDMAVAVALGYGGDWHGSRDAAQDAFVMALTQIGQLRDPDAFPGWFAALVRTACSRRARRGSPAGVALTEVETAHPGSVEPDTAVLAAERTLMVRRAVEALPEHERTVIALHYLGDLSYPEIAGFLGITEAATRKRAYSARRRLKEILAMTTNELTDARPSRTTTFRDQVAAFAAVRRRDRATLRRLLESSPELLLATESWGWEEAVQARLGPAQDGSLLIRAVETGDFGIVELLLDAGAAVDGRCHCQGHETPLWAAVLAGHREIVERLLAAGADPNARSHSGATPLHVATLRAPELVPLLLAAGADRSRTDRMGRTAEDWGVLAPEERAATGHPGGMVVTGIRAVDLFAPIRRGDRQYWPPVIRVGQLVLPYAIADAIAPVELWWIGFAYGGHYDHASIEHAGRELGVPATIRLAAQGIDDAQRRAAFSNAVRELAASDTDKLAVCLIAPGYRHEITLALHTLANNPTVIATIAIDPLTNEPAEVSGHPPEGYDTQLALDPDRARRWLYPAIDPALSITRNYPSPRHQQLAEDARTLLARYRKLDPELELPPAVTLADPSAAAAQQLLRYLVQPLRIAEPFHSLPGQSTPYREMLDQIETIIASKRTRHFYSRT